MPRGDRPTPPRRPPGPRRPAPLSLIPSIHRATHRIGLWLARHGAPGVMQAESHILAVLAAAGPSTVAELHRALAHRRSTLTSVLDRLEGRGLIRRRVAAGDRRSFVVELTRPGAALASAMLVKLAGLEREVVDALGPAATRRLARALDRIAR